MADTIYRPVRTAVSILGGLTASLLFSRLWKTVAGDENVPKATDRNITWQSALAVATIQGAFYGLVRAVIDRAGAVGFHRVAGESAG